MNLFRALLLFTLLALGSSALASNVTFADGTPGWNVSNGRCTFLVPGRIVNNDPAGNKSGTLRLCLWVMASPNATSGYRASIYSLGQLRGGYQYSNIKPSASYSIPRLTGSYYYHVSLEEYTNSGWVTRDEGGASVKTLKNGAFVVQKKWAPPAGKVVAPKQAWKIGENLNLTLQGSELYSGAGVVVVPAGSQFKLRVKINANGMTTVYGGSKPQGAPAKYTYSVQQGEYGGKSYPIGYLVLDYGYLYNVESKSRVSLFFQNAAKGFYKSTETDQGANASTWGVFSVTK